MRDRGLRLRAESNRPPRQIPCHRALLRLRGGRSRKKCCFFYADLMKTARGRTALRLAPGTPSVVIVVVSKASEHLEHLGLIRNQGVLGRLERAVFPKGDRHEFRNAMRHLAAAPGLDVAGFDRAAHHCIRISPLSPATYSAVASLFFGGLALAPSSRWT
jgi:hypothetical protein